VSTLSREDLRSVGLGVSGSVLRLLYGLALENLLKALLIARDEELVDTGGRLKREYRHHRLLNYAKAARLHFSDADAAFDQSA
jgi:hypothetical protein